MKRIDKTKLFLICLFGGWFGLHHFVRKNQNMGVLYLLTGGLFAIGWFVDTIQIIFAKSDSDIFKIGKKDIRRTNNQKNINNHMNSFFNNVPNNLWQEDKIITKHFQLLEKINNQYSIAINQTQFNNEVNKAISLCKQDNKLAHYVRQQYRKEPPEYPSFFKLSRLYELYFSYLEGIKPCMDGIKYHFADEIKLKKRIAILINKYNKKEKKNIQYDYDNNILYNDDTGEIIDLNNIKNN